MTSPISHSSNPFLSTSALPQETVAPTLEFGAPTQNQTPNVLGEFVGLMHYPRELLERFILDMPISDREINPGKHLEDVLFSFNYLKRIFASPATIAKWIEQNKIRLIDLTLNSKKLNFLFSDLTYLDFDGVPDYFPFELLENCKTLKTLIAKNLSDEHLVVIGKLTTLTSLDISISDKHFSSQITDAGLKELAKLKQLTELNLSGCSEITDDGFVTLETLTALEKLNLKDCVALSSPSMATIQKFKDLTHLNLCECYNFSEEDLTLLCTLKALTDLNLRGSQMTYLVKLGNLTSLNISCCQDLTKESFTQLLELKGSLTCLDLSMSNWLTDIEVRQLTGFTKLTTLSLQECNSITDASLASLAELNQLTSLNLHDCENFTSDGLPLLGKLVNLSSLLLHGGGSLTDASLKSITKLKKLTKLQINEALFLTNVNCLQELEALTHLELNNAFSLNNKGIEGIGQLTNLKKLSLNQCFYLSAINCIQSLSNLAILELNGLRINEAGVKDLANLKNLSSLTLESCDQIKNIFFESGFKNLTHLALINCKNLTYINLSTIPKVYLRLRENSKLRIDVKALAEHPNFPKFDLGFTSREHIKINRSTVQFPYF